MGVKKVLPSFQIVGGSTGVDGTMTGTTAINSKPTNIQNLDNVGLQISWTGDAVGSLAISCSIDNVNFIPLTLTIPQPAGVANTGFLVNLNQIPFPYVAVQYLNASGSGALSAFICGKDLN